MGQCRAIWQSAVEYIVRRQRLCGSHHKTYFDFLGLTHICSQTRTGKVTGRRKTVAKRLRTKWQAITQTLRERRHGPLRPRGAWLTRGLTGHARYAGVPRNRSRLRVLRARILRSWCHTRRRRSQRHRSSGQRIDALAAAWLPPPHILHPSPAQRLRVTTRGRSPVRECRTPGSVRGVPGNWHPYRDRQRLCGSHHKTYLLSGYSRRRLASPRTALRLMG